MLPLCAISRGRVVLLALLCALGGCGDGAGESGSVSARQEGIERAEARATEAEAKAQELRERLRALEAQGARTVGSGTGGGGAEDSTGAIGGGPILPSSAHDGFAALARSLPGEVGLAVSPVGLGQRVEQLGPLQRAIAWSTSKVPVAMAATVNSR